MDFHEGNYRYLIWTIHPRIIDSRFRYGYQLAFPHELGLNHHFGCCDPFFMNLRWCDPFLPCLMVKPCQNPPVFSYFPLFYGQPHCSKTVSTAAPGHQVQALKQPAGSPGPWSAAPGFFHRCGDGTGRYGISRKVLGFYMFL